MKLPVLFLLMTLAISFESCLQDPNEKIREQAINDDKFKTRMEWTYTEKQLNPVEEGQSVEINYPFKNTGDKPLVIKNVSATCGCTVPEVPKEPIMPGKSGVIRAVFNSVGRGGENIKHIAVYSNAENSPQQLEFKIVVHPRKEKT